MAFVASSAGTIVTEMADMMAVEVVAMAAVVEPIPVIHSKTERERIGVLGLVIHSKQQQYSQGTVNSSTTPNQNRGTVSSQSSSSGMFTPNNSNASSSVACQI